MPARSRTGCLTCRQRKLKCDEQRPVCSQCIKAQRPCVPSSGITFRHQQNPSMNGTDDDDGNLKSFYGYKETFKKGTQWVKIPPELTFVHTKNPYEDVDEDFERDGQVPITYSLGSAGTIVDPVYDRVPSIDNDANMSSASAAYDSISERLLAGLVSAAQTAVAESSSRNQNDGKLNEYELDSPSYPQYATRGLQALSAVASQDHYSTLEMPSFVRNSPVETAVSTSPQQGSNGIGRQIISHPPNSSAILSSAADSNIDPRLHTDVPLSPVYQVPPSNLDQPTAP